ncbi:hypothetical protein VE23_18385 [Paenibacillus sp. D9]|nr:hypothetical protein VE23_18385 [Paenibacillus sp. D9]CDN41598.1 Uncharacterized protein BN871_AI_01090 [Paenibacillus sp. P22]
MFRGGIVLSVSQIDLQAFLQTHEQLQRAIEGLSEEQLQIREAPGKWSITEVLAHLADHSIVVSFRIRDILADTEARLPAFDQDRWVSGQKSNQGRAEDILAVFKSLLQFNSLLLSRLDEAGLAKTGVNFKGETVRIPDIVRGFVRHVQGHLGQIERIKQTAQSVH